jgi:hypothetical protein
VIRTLQDAVTRPGNLAGGELEERELVSIDIASTASDDARDVIDQ